MVTTHDAELGENMRTLCLHGISKDAWNRYAENGNWYYEVVACGFKYNLSDIQSAIGIHQLRKQEKFIAARREYARMYQEGLAEMSEIEPAPDSDACRHSWHLYSLRLNLDKLTCDRAEFIRDLHGLGICASVHFIPIPLHPYYASRNMTAASCPLALRLYPRLVSLPLYPSMAEEQVQRVIAAVKDLAWRHSKTVAISCAGV
jgi:dTDP-4-amino-4,6-dideoxygalactose transaminase